MAAIIYHAKIDPKTGDIYFNKNDCIEQVRVFKLVMLASDPFEWVSTVLKDTDNRNKDFVKKFVDGAGLMYENLEKVAEWFPSYYAAFLMEASNAISLLSFSEFRSRLAAALEEIQKGLGKIADGLPEVDGSTKIGELSDALNPLTSIGTMLICYN